MIDASSVGSATQSIILLSCPTAASRLLIFLPVLDGLHEAEGRSQAFVLCKFGRMLVITLCTIPMSSTRCHGEPWPIAAAQLSRTRGSLDNHLVGSLCVIHGFSWLRDIVTLPRRACFQSTQSWPERSLSAASPKTRSVEGLALLRVPHSEHGQQGSYLARPPPVHCLPGVACGPHPAEVKRVAARAGVKQSQVLEGSARRVASLAAVGCPSADQVGATRSSTPLPGGVQDVQPTRFWCLDGPVQPWCEIEVPLLPLDLANGIETRANWFPGPWVSLGAVVGAPSSPRAWYPPLPSRAAHERLEMATFSPQAIHKRYRAPSVRLSFSNPIYTPFLHSTSALAPSLPFTCLWLSLSPPTPAQAAD